MAKLDAIRIFAIFIISTSLALVIAGIDTPGLFGNEQSHKSRHIHTRADHSRHNQSDHQFEKFKSGSEVSNGLAEDGKPMKPDSNVPGSKNSERRHEAHSKPHLNLGWHTHMNKASEESKKEEMHTSGPKNEHNREQFRVLEIHNQENRNSQNEGYDKIDTQSYEDCTNNIIDSKSRDNGNDNNGVGLAEYGKPADADSNETERNTSSDRRHEVHSKTNSSLGRRTNVKEDSEDLDSSGKKDEHTREQFIVLEKQNEENRKSQNEGNDKNGTQSLEDSANKTIDTKSGDDENDISGDDKAYAINDTRTNVGRIDGAVEKSTKEEKMRVNGNNNDTQSHEGLLEHQTFGHGQGFENTESTNHNSELKLNQENHIMSREMKTSDIVRNKTEKTVQSNSKGDNINQNQVPLVVNVFIRKNNNHIFGNNRVCDEKSKLCLIIKFARRWLAKIFAL